MKREPLAGSSRTDDARDPGALAPKDPRVWQRIDVLLSEALTLPPGEREGWLSRLSPEDQPLASSLRVMLSRSATTDSFLRDPISPEMLAAAGEVTSLEQVGTMVGPYRLLRVLGAGGMGQVWLAERVDGTIQRQVALKLPRTRWAPGMAERLKQERDALAALEHPSIARLYDAGVTAEGRPYLAMEYVDGVPIDRHAAARRLSLRQRLALFLQVAGAVSYAHAHLVVHRDLKPSNILVSESQGLRLLDFGAAKLLREEGPGDSDLTRELGPALSPDYASPEQIRGERVSVATDVYSLGIVLYELLTGERPYRLPRESWAALIEAMERTVIPPASSRLRADPRLARALRGDLDAVLARALRRDPADRYASVQAFADDVSRWLAGEPVVAKTQSLADRALKFVRRNALPVATVSLVTLLVGAAAGVAFWQARVARSQARRAERVRGFIASILTSATPRTGVGGVVTAADLLTAAAGRIESELGAEPEVAAELGFIVAQSFDSLGEAAKAEEVLRSTVPRAEKALGRTHLLTLEAKGLLANEINYHDLPGSLALIEEILPDARRGLPATAEVLVAALRDKSFALAKFNDPEPSYAPLVEGIEIAEKYFGPIDERTIDVLELQANTYGRFGDRKRELAAAEDAVERARRAFGAKRPHKMLSDCERSYADALRRSDRPADAAALLRRVVADQQQLDVVETLRVRNAKIRLGISLQQSGKLEEGLPLIREAVALERAQNPAESDDRLGYGEHLARVLADAERLEEWMAQETELTALIGRLGTKGHRSRLGGQVRRARLAALLGRSEEAQRLVRDTRAMATAEEASARVQAELAGALDSRLQLRASDALERLEAMVRESPLDGLPERVQSNVAAELGMAQLELGDLPAAESSFTRCQEHFARGQIEPSVLVSDCLVGSARAQLRSARFAEAEQLLLPLAASWEHVNPESPRRGEVLHWLARAEAGLGNHGAAARDARLAGTLLRGSNLPALRQLIGRAGERRP